MHHAAGPADTLARPAAIPAQQGAHRANDTVDAQKAPATPGWTPATLGSLAYFLFALQQPGTLDELRTADDVRAEGLLAPAEVANPTVELDPFLRRKNLLGEIGSLNL